MIEVGLLLQLLHLVILDQLKALLKLAIEFLEFVMRTIERLPLGGQFVFALLHPLFAQGHVLFPRFQGVVQGHHRFRSLFQGVDAERRRGGCRGGCRSRGFLRNGQGLYPQAEPKPSGHKNQTDHSANDEIFHTPRNDIA